MIRIVLLLICILFQVQVQVQGEICQPNNDFEGAPIRFGYYIDAIFDHDPEAFTQGLLVSPHNRSLLLESTGLYMHSDLRKVDYTSGQIVENRQLNPSHFGEGIALIDADIFMLTWKARAIHRFDYDELRYLGTSENPVEQGWGLTYDNQFFILSDGSSILYFIYPENFTISHSITVRMYVDPENTVECIKLNELEYIDGKIWANIWYSDFILIIDPVSGLVLYYLDLGDLERNSNADVLNGIAYNNETSSVFVTGKLWDVLYEIKISDTWNGGFSIHRYPLKTFGNPFKFFLYILFFSLFS